MEAFGKPGIPPTWASSAKDWIGTALGRSRVWYTLGRGIVNEVYWPATGRPQMRDLGFIVAKRGFWAEVKRVNRYRLEATPLFPTVRVVHEGEEYRLTLELVPDPQRDVLLIGYTLEGEGFRLYPLLAPHLGGTGYGNTAWVKEGALLAATGSEALALLGPFLRGSAGYVGFSDGWQDFAQNGAMTWTFARAADGNVALMGELEGKKGVMALAFATTPEGALTLGRSALGEGLETIQEKASATWSEIASPQFPGEDEELLREAQVSYHVLKVHEDRTYPGALVASLSVPWGNTRDDPGGYHLVWSRDLVEVAFAYLALGQFAETRGILTYLAAVQAEDGHWAQNFYPDGRAYWQGVQMDEAALPVLLALKFRELGQLSPNGPLRQMVRRAVGFLAREGPVSPQDRWEESPGLSPFTLAVSVAALSGAALYGFLQGEEAEYALSLADCWNVRIEEWGYVKGSGLDRAVGVEGHYVRLSPSGPLGPRGRVQVANRAGVAVDVAELLGLEFLWLVRLGLRRPQDPRIVSTLALVDRHLRVDLPTGIFYRRYPEDGYGEHGDGSAFDGTGQGRAWPLLTGERGMYALLSGEDPCPYLRSMARGTGRGRLIPEQVWDADPIPEKGLLPGRPTGSAQPLLWAHAEYLKLYTAYHQRTGPVERLGRVMERYERGSSPQVRHWRREVPVLRLSPTERLLVECRKPFRLHLGWEGWKDPEDVEAEPLPFGLYGVLLDLEDHSEVNFTFFYPDENRWEGRDYQVRRG
ncbi:glucan 1,4-alpha-glucosidase [Thermus scotoductus]|uniref:Glucan 1,4-alpha-glucosidase n=1 Tax=Thermus scotoductus TaxID=37636 RepID=A0A430UL32_THESC|nr:glycoside hydrolase family 15 protein [Thermus scotoductus]RTH15378.1 glucan 1,4-alpha-glucosidase [Thermus scotoductus]RTH29840.1 glucan 1,4-alpha-glucosidase [Thermus scotoductus]RTH38698.1 glucan 1,4-alpha-glucosidase [Thermus scotoductus]RTI04327.1 glucan 1,4-alpha-glucosidase [Thermus scotoductus]RTI05295.1 glucan 1,4-alpha-glucosidase [Thermus scotoductus]